MKRTFAALTLAAIVLAGCSGGSKRAPANTTTQPAGEASSLPDGTAFPAATATPMNSVGSGPAPCKAFPEICLFAQRVEAWVRQTDVLAIVKGSAWDNQAGRARVESVLQAARNAPGAGAPALIGVGCPFGPTMFEGCGEAFSLAFSTLPEGHRIPEPEGMFVLGFDRGSGNPRLSEVTSVSERQFREAIVTGSLVQALGLSGKPETRAQFFALQTPATDATILGVPVRDWQVVSPADLPLGVALFIERGCWGCEGPPTRVDRVYRGSDGQYRIEKVFPPAGVSEAIRSFATRLDTQEIIATTCFDGNCGGVGESTPGVKSNVYRSTDGGISWKKERTLGGYAAARMSVGGWLLDRSVYDAVGGGWQRSVEWYAGGTKLGMPVGEHAALFTSLSFLPAWRADPTAPFVLSDGTPWFSSPLGDQASIIYGVNPIAALGDGRLVASWYHGGGGESRQYLGVFDATNPSSSRLEAVHRAPRPGLDVMFGPFLGANPAFGNATLVPADVGVPSTAGNANFFGNIPVAIDIGAGTITPLTLFGPMFGNGYGGRNIVVGAITGLGLARIKTGGECLNVRVDPNASSMSLGCFKDGVLLRIGKGAPLEWDSTTWVPVVLPSDLVAGWAAAEYLER